MVKMHKLCLEELFQPFLKFTTAGRILLQFKESLFHGTAPAFCWNTNKKGLSALHITSWAGASSLGGTALINTSGKSGF